MTLAVIIEALTVRGLAITQIHPELSIDDWDGKDRCQALRNAFVTLTRQEQQLDLRHLRALARLTSPAANKEQVQLLHALLLVRFIFSRHGRHVHVRNACLICMAISVGISGLLLAR
jgi:hypothetical protein